MPPRKARGVLELARPSRVRVLNLMSPAFGPCDGYGNSAEQMSLALERAGVRVSLFGTIRYPGVVRASEIRMRPPELGDAIVYYAQPNAWDKRDDRPTYGFSMYESDTLPTSWHDRIPNVSEVWVPAKWQAAHFGEHTDREVHVIPLGVNADDFAPSRRERGRKLRFLACATNAGELRKGVDLAVKAFDAAFGDRQNVELVVRSTFQCLFDDVSDRVSFVTGQLPTSDLAEFYRGFDALIYPSRGEGFGLIPLEFMATGGPAIFPAATGMKDYAEFGLPVSTTKAPATVGFGRGQSVSGTPYGFWEEPILDQIVERLREIDRNYDAVMDQSIRDAAAIATKWSWDRTAHAMIERLEA